ncbi:MAG: TIGR03960 family B12-binding radical SAM protein [Planctomycetaceae bacterium]|nr:TIGR03960 family B12-binding radical SAM protein [Planctomycetaceae bacterium]
MRHFTDPQLRRTIESLLLSDVRQPGQYIGGELGAVAKDPERVRYHLALAFPDTYTIGMSHFGFQLLYTLINRKEDWICERVFTPLPDMENALKSRGLPLYSLETFRPLDRFDVLGFSLQYEMSYTNVLTMLDLGRIPLDRTARAKTHPLVIAGGPCVGNPEPMSPFIDLFVIGDGEEALEQVCDFWVAVKQNFPSESRREWLLRIAWQFPFVYVPEFYDVVYDANGRALTPKPNEPGVPEIIRPAVVDDIERFVPSLTPIVPLIESVQDRVSLEIMRGCPGRCKFCQSTAIKRPIRTRSVESIAQIAYQSCLNTGMSEVSLLSLSTSDYPQFEQLMTRLRELLTPLKVSISVPSLRVNHLLSKTMQSLTTERSGGLTIAPEAARDEMRRRIGKPITNENLLAGCQSAFENGFGRVKMYFMCGLPEETDADLDGITDLAKEVTYLGKKVSGRFPVVVANVSNFVPKPHTPFERCGMMDREAFREAHKRLKYTNKDRSFNVKYHELSLSLLEGLLSRGDRRVGKIIETVWRKGARLDSWTEHFRSDLWDAAIAESGVDADQIIHTPYGDDAKLPWGHVRF